MIPEAAELCTFCLNLIPPKEGCPLNQAHHPNVGLLEQSSKRCSICKVLFSHWSLEKVQQDYPGIDRISYESIAFKIKLKTVKDVGSGLSWAILETSFYVRGFIYVSNFSITTCNTECIDAKQPIWRAARTSPLEKLSILRSWLHDCESRHQDCQPVVSQLPKRLIDIGLQDESSPRLVISKDLHCQHIKYSTLSYCWGNTSFCTTRENENLYKQEIPYKYLPRTLQDALTLSRDLHIRYIWIDSLCIVQDDDAEWESEASKMRDIYAGSSITIAAADADDASVGFLPSELRENNDTDGAGAFFTTENRESSSFLVRIQPGDTRTVTGDSVLNTRGWVLQEMVLSHRIVYYRPSEISWECRSECRTETGVHFDRSGIDYSSIPVLPCNNQNGMIKTWWRWMQSYSRRRFSFSKDRLSALAGITLHYQMAAKDVPILGLWENSLPQDLLWMRVKILSENADPPPHHLPNIPSWSWLSCPYEVSFDFWNSEVVRFEVLVELHDHVNLVEWAVVWTSEPWTSNVKLTRLVVNGPTQEIVLSVAPRGKDNNPTYLDVNDEEPDFGQNIFPWRCSGQFDNGPRMSPTRYLCLLLRTTRYREENLIRETFLILEQFLAVGTYRRVGIAHFLGDSQSFNPTVRQTLVIV